MSEKNEKTEKKKLVGIDGGKKNSSPSSSSSSSRRGPGPGVLAGRKPNRVHELVAEEEFPASEYMVPATDSRGHSVSVNTSVPPDMKRSLDVILGSQKFPFRTLADVVRWCVSYGSRALIKKGNDGHFPRSYVISNTWIAETSEEMALQEMSNRIAYLKKSLRELVEKRHFDAARRILVSIERSVGDLDDPYWAPKIQKEIISYYRWLKYEKRAKEEDDQFGPRPKPEKVKGVE